VNIERIRNWTPELEEGLCYALGGDRDIIAAAVNAGRLEAFRLFGGEAYMVTRVERGTITVCCYQGARVREAAEWLFERKKQLGLGPVRFHTRRPGLARLLKGFGFEHKEHVFEARA
jgi:hypothetical protein